jgi:hypothetical protein
MQKWTITLDNSIIEFLDENSAIVYQNTHGGTLGTYEDNGVPLSHNDKKEIQDKLLADAWGFITPYYDQPAFIQMSDWKHSLPSDHPVQLLIAAVETWKSAIMFEYLMNKKPSMWADAPYDNDYSFIGPPPCSFTDMFLTVNPSLAPGYTPPDVSSYTPGAR